MFAKHDLDDVINKVGGKFKTTVTVQKRLKGLAAGASNTIPHTERSGLSLFEVVFEEIMRDNIHLTLANTHFTSEDQETE